MQMERHHTWLIFFQTWQIRIVPDDDHRHITGASPVQRNLQHLLARAASTSPDRMLPFTPRKCRSSFQRFYVFAITTEKAIMSRLGNGTIERCATQFSRT